MEATESHKLKAANTIPDSLVGQDRWLSPTRPGFNSRSGKPPELRWQSGRLLTDRSLVRSQVVASKLFFLSKIKPKFPIQPSVPPKSQLTRTHGATAARRIPDPKVGGSNPSGFTSKPPELRWQSGRLLTDRSLVRSQVVAHLFCTISVMQSYFVSLGGTDPRPCGPIG